MRQERLIRYLSEHEIVSVDELLNEFHISVRTLTNDIRFASELGESKGFAIKRIRGRGYRLEVTEEDTFARFIQEMEVENSTSDDPEKRLKNLELTLLFQEDYITLQQLADLMEVSLTTIKQDLKKTNDFFTAQQLKLHSKAHYGIKVIGNEREKRQTIIALLKSNLEVPVSTMQYQTFEANFDEEKIRAFLTAAIDRYDLKTNDVVFANIVQHLKLLAFRIAQNNLIIETVPANLEPSSIKYREFTEDISEFLAETYQIQLPESEKDYLLEQLRGKITVLDDEESNQRLRAAIAGALNQLDEKYKTRFSKDLELQNALLLHVSPLLQRLYTGHQLDNPLIEDIYTRYANVFNLAIEFIASLNADLNTTISKDEIGYLAIYFTASLEKQSAQELEQYRKIAVICATGGGASYLLKVTLERLFANANVETFSAMELAKIDQSYDLVISTIPLENPPAKIPIVYTKAVLTDVEIRKIEQDLNLLRENKLQSVDVNQRLLQLFRPEWFGITDKDYLTTLKDTAITLENEGAAEKGFSASVLEREEMIDTIYRNGVGGPHPMEAMAIHEGIAVRLFRPNQQYQGKPVRIFFLINIAKGHLTLHKEISHLLIRMMEDQELERQLTKITTYQEFMMYVTHLLEKGPR